MFLLADAIGDGIKQGFEEMRTEWRRQRDIERILKTARAIQKLPNETDAQLPLVMGLSALVLKYHREFGLHNAGKEHPHND